MPEKLTEAKIKALTYEGKPAVVRDAKVTGLLVAVNKTGKSYKVQRDLWQGQRGRKVLVKTVRHTLGGTEEMTLDDARSKATAMLDLIKRGIDPNAPPPEPSADAGGWTVRRMFEEYGADMRTRDCVERSITDMMERLDRYLPRWCDLPVTDIRRSAAREEHRRITVNHGATTANKATCSQRSTSRAGLERHLPVPEGARPCGAAHCVTGGPPLLAEPGDGTAARRIRRIRQGVAGQRVARKHRDALVWRIVARVDGTRQDADKAERRAVTLTRAVFGRHCLNLREGGQGMSSRDARALRADPEWAGCTGAAIREAHARPEVRARMNAAANTPDAKARLSATHKALAKTDERREQIARATAASLTPEARAKRNTGQSAEARAKRRASLKAYAATPEGQEVQKRAIAANKSPAVQARLLTRAVNEYRRWAEAHPEAFEHVD